jgi:hypothetical protein
MPKREEAKPAKSKMTFIMFQLDGGDETLQQSFRTIGQALQNSFQHAKALPNRAAQPTGALPEQEVEAELVEPDNQEETNGQEPSTPAKPRPRSVPKSPEVLNLDLNSGTPPLKEFLAQKNPGDMDSKRYLAIAYWFKNSFNTPEVTVNHIHTAYRHMGWQTPKDAGIPLRDLKNKNQWLGKGSSTGSYIINHVGENQVMEMGGGN